MRFKAPLPLNKRQIQLRQRCSSQLLSQSFHLNEQGLAGRAECRQSGAGCWWYLPCGFYKHLEIQFSHLKNRLNVRTRQKLLKHTQQILYKPVFIVLKRLSVNSHDHSPISNEKKKTLYIYEKNPSSEQPWYNDSRGSRTLIPSSKLYIGIKRNLERAT